MPNPNNVGSQIAYDIGDGIYDVTKGLRKFGDIKSKAISYLADTLAGIVPGKWNDRVFHFAGRIADTLSDFAFPLFGRRGVTTGGNALSALGNAVSGDWSQAKTRGMGALKSAVSPVVDIFRSFKDQLRDNKKLKDTPQFAYGMNP